MIPPKVNENSSMDIAKIFTTLNNASCSLTNKQLAYTSLTRYLTEEDGLNNSFVQERSDQLLKFLLQDSLIENNEIIRSLLKVLHHYITEDRNSAMMKESTAYQILLRILKGEYSDEVNNEILNCLSFQKFQPAVLTLDIQVLIERLEDMHGRKKTHSDQFIERLVDTVFRLEEQLGQKLAPEAGRWVFLVIQGLTHPSQDTRMKSMELVSKFKSLLTGNTEFVRNLIKMMNADVSKNLKTLLSKDCQHVTKVWSMLLELVGKNIHKGPTINAMLQIVEPAFKGQPEDRICAFRAWRSLVDNFALDPDVMSEPKRIRLLMMVMKVDNAKTEAVAMEKLRTWWHFVCQVNTKLSMNFEQIFYPLLQFCVGNSKLHSTGLQHVSSPWMSLSMSSSGKNGPARGVSQSLQVFPSLQKAGCEIIGHILSKTLKGDASPAVSWAFDPLTCDLFSNPASFVKHAPFVMSAVYELFKNVGSEIEESLVLHIWSSLSNHLRCAMDSMKMECRDAFSAFLSHLYAMVQGQVFKEQLLFKMLLTSCNFTQKILASTAFTLGGGNVRGCPALLLTEIMFMPMIVKHSSSSEQYVKLFSSLVNAGVSNHQGALVFLQAVTALVDSRVHDLPSSDFLWRLWSTIAHTLHEHINTTNEVNQGDALEYNFGCLYTTLLLPIKRQMPSKVSQAVGKTIVRTWKELYHTFARLSALVATAEANTCLEELCSKILRSWQPEFKDPSSLEFLCSVCQKMTDCIDFSALSVGQSHGSGLTLSPSRWAKRRNRPMANLYSFVHLMAKIQSEINDLLVQINEKKIDLKHDNLASSVTASVHAVVEISSHLFSHITSGLVSHVIATLCPSLSRLYSSNTKTGTLKIFVPSFMTKLEKLWQEIVNCVTGRYNDQYDSYFLALLSPMLEETFLHSRRGIKSQTVTLWTSTFSKSSSLTYPDNLKTVLEKVKEKTALVLPGWIVSPEQVIAETPFSQMSQMSQGDSLIPTPVLPGLPSPKRLPKGSFIARDISPARPSLMNNKVSPAKVVSPKEVRALFSSSRKNISMDLNMMRDEDFVVISSPLKRKRRLLTEHQKEVLKEKSVIPAMYNNLDASIEMSLSNFNDTQQESMSSLDLVAKNERGSQKEQRPSQGCTEEDKAHPLKDASSETSSSRSFSVPKNSKVIRRRSIRISSVKSDDGSKVEESTKKKTQDHDTSIDSSSLSNLSKSLAKKQSVELLITEKDKNIPCERETQVTINKDKDTGDETEPAAFRMFRTRGQISENLSKTVEEPGLPTPDTRPRRVSLRKVHSYDLTSEDKSNESSAAGKCKSPRRVPLRKLNEQRSQVEEKSDKSALLLNNSSKNKSEETCSKVDTAASNDSKNGKSRLDDWLISGSKKTKEPPFSNTVTKESPPVDFRAPEVVQSRQENRKESFTWVEDTQSPRKTNLEKKDSSTGHESIAETPNKSDENATPSPKCTRNVRKLFIDSELDSQISDSASQKSEAEGSHQMDCNKEKDNLKERDIFDKDSEVNMDFEVNKDSDVNKDFEVNKDSEVVLFDSDAFISSSQGFNVPTESPNKANKESSESTGSQEVKNKELDTKDVVKNCEKNATDFPDDETLSDSPMQTCESSDMSMMAMPTLASQSNSAVSKSASSSSSSKSSSSNESNKKLTPSTESDFDPSQSTLKDDFQDKPTKEETNRCCTRLRLQTKAKRLCPCCSPEKVNEREDEEKVESTAQNVLYGKETSDNELEDKEDSEVPSITVVEEKTLIEYEGCNEKITIGEMPIIGEVTPDVKSPSESTPVKRNSTTKNRRKAAKRLSEHLNVEQFSKVPDPTTFSNVLDRDVATATKTSEMQKNSKLTETRSPCSLKRRQGAISSPKSARSKHLLRTRTKVVRRLSASPPTKSLLIRKRKLKKVLGENSNKEYTDDQPLSFLKKRRVVSKSDDQSTDDEDEPLSLLVRCKKEDLNEVSASQEKEQKVMIVEQNEAVSQIAKIKDATAERLSAEVNEDGNSHTDSMEVQVVPDPESVESQSPSLLVHTPQVAVGSQEDDKVETLGEASQESSESDEVFEKEKGSPQTTDVNTEEELFEVVAQAVEEVTAKTENAEEDMSVEKVTEEIPESAELILDTPVKEREEPEQEALVYTPSQWSPSKSPSCSILKKLTPASEKQSRHVSFAEPVVSGESPVREKYHAENLPTSPLICQTGSNAKRFSKSSSSPGKLMNRGTPYRRKLEGSLRKNEGGLARHRNSSSQTSVQSQNSYRPTQESQLDAVNPIFPDLVDCKASLDCILPQLTSSLWHRGLCQLMKGRNLHTIGDLSSLTEVQINQMPIRHPKVQTVRDTLMSYLNQHGNSKGSRSIFACAATPLDDAFSSPKSTGATLHQAITPSSIADEGMKILPSIEDDLSQLSPIIDPTFTCDEDISQPEASTKEPDASTKEISSVPNEDESQAATSTSDTKVISTLSSFISASHTGMKDVSMTDLFDIHQKLNVLMGVVVEEMKDRQPKK